MDCIRFPVRDVDLGAVAYITHGVLVPVLFGVGLMGNLVTIVLCNNATLRRDNAVFIHICGLAAVNAISLLCTVPDTIQEVEIFPTNVTFSRQMAHAHMVCYLFGVISHDAALWLLVILGFFTLYNAKNPYRRSRMSRNSTNRIVVFVTVLVCALFNFPRFLVVSVKEVVGHCFVGMSLWIFHVSEFGGGDLFFRIYPWLATGFCQALPLLLIMVAALSLWQHAGWRRLHKARIALQTAIGDDHRRLGLVKTIWIALLVAFSLELPSLAFRIYAYLSGLSSESSTLMYCAELVVGYLLLIQNSIGFFIYSVYCSDFRKALRRTFCCLCADEFYEPCACCNATYRRHLKDVQKLDPDQKETASHRVAPKTRTRADRYSRKPMRVGHTRRAYNSFDPDRTGSVYSWRSGTNTSVYYSGSVSSMRGYDVIDGVRSGNASGAVTSAGGRAASPTPVTSSGQKSDNLDGVSEHPWV